MPPLNDVKRECTTVKREGIQTNGFGYTKENPLDKLAGCDLTLLNPIMKRNIAVITILRAPTCIGVKPTSANFIRINELPQIKERIPRYNHFN